MRKVIAGFALLAAACGGGPPAGPGTPAPGSIPVSLTSVTVSPTTVAGGAAAVGTVTLTAPASANGTSVNLVSSHAAVRVSPVLVVPAGATSATFAVTTETVSSDADVTITASLDNVTRTTTLRVTAAPGGTGTGPLVGLSTAVDDVVSGDPTTGTIAAASPAPAGGIRVDLASSDSDVTVPSFVVIAAGTTSASFDIRTSIVLVEKDVRLTATVSGTNQAVASQVLAVIKLRVPGPRVDSVSPANAQAGTSVTVTLTGAMFLQGATVSVSGSGVSVSGVVIDSLSSMRATLTVSSSAAAGERQISVVTSGGSSSVAFSVGNVPPPSGPPPTITSLQPTEVRRGTTGGMTIHGTNFTAGSTVAIGDGTRVTIGPTTTFINSNVLVTGYVAHQDAALGSRTVTVTTPGGGTSAGHALLVVQFPSLTSISPNSALTGTTVDFTLGGRDLIAPLTVELSGCTGVTINSISHVSETQVIVRATIAGTASVGFCSIRVVSGGWGTFASFDIIPPPPTITALSQNPYTGNGPVDLVITGTEFRGRVTTQVTGGGTTVEFTFPPLNSQTVTARISLDASFTSGDRFVTVTTSGGTSNAFKWTINRPSLSGGQ